VIDTADDAVHVDLLARQGNLLKELENRPSPSAARFLSFRRVVTKNQARTDT
jgi:hypothetical protein